MGQSQSGDNSNQNRDTSNIDNSNQHPDNNNHNNRNSSSNKDNNNNNAQVEMSGDEKADHLTLSTNPKVAQMLQKKGDKGVRETVLFSDLVIKINRKDKEQTVCC